MFFFFFPSRRRHTRFDCDWSSDVCSSDLGQAQGLLPLMGLGGQAVLEQLRALATRQRALAEQLERLQAAGGSAAAGPLAEEARELARQLEAGRLDRQTIQRQSRPVRRPPPPGAPP